MAEASSISRSSVVAGHHRKISPAAFISPLKPETSSCLAAQTDHRPGTAYPASTVRTCTPAAEEGVPVPGGMEQGVLNVQPAQVGAAPDEVPLCPEAGKPVPQVVAGAPGQKPRHGSERNYL